MQWDQVITYYLLYSLGGLVILFTVMHMLYKGRSPSSMTAWLLLMVIAPYFFVLFYFFFGIRKRSLYNEKAPLAIEEQNKDLPSVHALDTLLQNNGAPACTQDNSLDFYTDAEEAYKALKNAIEGAKHSISLSTYVLKNDAVTQELCTLLMTKAKAGVDVRILTDAFGSLPIYLYQSFVKKLREAGIQVSFFKPLFSLNFHHRLNLRYHRKIYLIDNQVLFSGGMNLAEEYMGPTPLKGRWSDLLYRCEGSILNSYVHVFEADWAFTKHTLPKKIEPVSSAHQGKQRLQAVPSGPDVINDTLLEAILSSLYKASKRVWIVTPYFIPNGPILQALHIARHRGIDVKVITPKKSNHPIADLGRSSYLRELQEAGIDVALHQGPLLHAKAILFDDELAIMGSVNLDDRSLLLNYEIVTLAYSKEEVEYISQWMQMLLNNSVSDLGSAGKLRRIFENLMRIFSPQL